MQGCTELSALPAKHSQLRTFRALRLYIAPRDHTIAMTKIAVKPNFGKYSKILIAYLAARPYSSMHMQASSTFLLRETHLEDFGTPLYHVFCFFTDLPARPFRSGASYIDFRRLLVSPPAQ